MKDAGQPPGTDRLASTECEPRRWQRAAVLLVGWLLPQFLLYGSDLIGSTVPLPLDLLALPDHYLPQTAAYAEVSPDNAVLSDLVLIYPLARQFAVREIHAGRLPLWDPDNFAGTPFCWAVYSPFEWPHFVFPSPTTLAWTQLLQSLTLAGGMYVFARKSLGVSFWPAAIGSCCAPWIGFMVLWKGYPASPVVALFPWLLTAADRAVRSPWSAAPPALAMFTGVLLVSGQLDVAGQALLATGLFSLWSLYDRYRDMREWRLCAAGATAAAIAWLAGFLIASPGFLPLIEYSKTGLRMERRSGGEEERPPFGIAALPQAVLPELYGNGSRNLPRYAPDNQLESSATAYVGLLATLFLAPLAWFDRTSRSQNLFFCFLAVLGLAWSANLPGLVHLLRLPGLNMFSHNRFTLVSAIAIMALAMRGMNVLWSAEFRWRGWCLVPMAVALFLAVMMLARAIDLPEPMRSQWMELARGGRRLPGLENLDAVRQAQSAFVVSFLFSAALGFLTALAWWGAAKEFGGRRWFLACIGLVWLGELLWFAGSQVRRSDPSLYYPRIPILERLAAAPPGRILGINCLPPMLNKSHHLRDIRGYDGVDPVRMVELLELARAPGTSSPSYAVTQWFIPAILPGPHGLQLSPVLDLLGVRYLIFRRPPPQGFSVIMQEDDYWVVENNSALPRTFVPRKVAAVNDRQTLLQALKKRGFNPAEQAYVDEPLDVPNGARGSVKIVSETPTRVEIEADMQTPALVVLADMWDAGWRATLDDVPTAIARVDLALRGVKTPAGRHRLVFSYEPASFALGVRLASGGLVVLACWFAVVCWRAKQNGLR